MKMIDDPRGRIDYEEAGVGPTLVLVPGSCSTGAAWRPLMAVWRDPFRCVTTSLLGYGGTAERRSVHDLSIAHEVDVVEAVIKRVGGAVHLIGHSFGGLVSLAVAMRGQVPLADLVIVEAPALELLRAVGDHSHYGAFRRMTDGYFAAFRSGNKEAIRVMIDFYGGADTYASWPPRVRDYAVKTTEVNIMDWASAQGFPLTPRTLANISTPTLVMTGTASHPAARRANELLSRYLSRAQLVVLEGAAHFMISTHASEVANRIANHVQHSRLASLATP
jgi:pimeloyl-ACP methyl ester carboxylesterase